MFNETESLPAGKFDRKLEENGAETNAATWVDWTYYYECLPADRIKLAVEARGRAHGAPRPPRAAGGEREGGRRQRAPLPRRRRRRGRGERAALQDGLHPAPLRLADHRLDGGHPGLHPRGLRRLLPDVLRAEQRHGRRRRRRARARRSSLAIRDAYGAIPASGHPRGGHRPRAAAASTRARSSSASPRRREKLLLAFKGPALGDADHATLTVLDRGPLRRAGVAPLPRARRRERARDRRARLGVAPSAIPGLFECWATARGEHTTQEMQAVLDARVRAGADGGRRATRSSRAPRRASSSALLQPLETISGKAEQIGFYETVLGDPAARVPPRRGLPPRHRRATCGASRAATSVEQARTIVRVLPEGPPPPRRPSERGAVAASAPPARFALDGGAVALLEASHAVPLVSLVVALRCGVRRPTRRQGRASRASPLRMLRRGCEGMTARADRLRASTRSAARWRSTRRRPRGHPRAGHRAATSSPFVDLLARLLSAPAVPRGRARAPRSARPSPRSSRRATTTAPSPRRRFQRTLFAGHPYGRSAGGDHRPGSRPSTATTSSGLLPAHVVRGNLVIGFAGDVTAERGAAARAAHRRRRARGARASGRRARAAGARAGGASSSSTSRSARRRRSSSAPSAPRPHDDDHVAARRGERRLRRHVHLAADARGPLEARLVLRRERAPSASTGTARRWLMWTLPRGGGRRRRASSSTLELMDAWVKDGVTPREVAFIQRYLVRSHAFEVDTRGQAAAPGARRGAPRPCRRTTTPRGPTG